MQTMTKANAVSQLSLLAKQEPVQYQATLMRMLSDLQGWTKDQGDSRSRSKPIATLLSDWRHAREPNVPATEGGGAPHEENEIEVLGNSPPAAPVEKVPTPAGEIEKKDKEEKS